MHSSRRRTTNLPNENLLDRYISSSFLHNRLVFEPNIFDINIKINLMIFYTYFCNTTSAAIFNANIKDLDDK